MKMCPIYLENSSKTHQNLMKSCKSVNLRRSGNGIAPQSGCGLSLPSRKPGSPPPLPPALLPRLVIGVPLLLLLAFLRGDLGTGAARADGEAGASREAGASASVRPRRGADGRRPKGKSRRGEGDAAAKRE